MRPAFLLAIITLALGGAGNAVSQTWRIGDDQPFPTHLASLPPERQRSILAHIEPSLKKLVNEKWLTQEELNKVEKSLLIREATTAYGPMTLVQSWGDELCGAVGNCHIWILGDHDQVLLESAGDELTILKTAHHAKPSILVAEHDSAADSDLTWYRFDGRKYRRLKCGTRRYAQSWDTFSGFRIESGPCSKEQ